MSAKQRLQAKVTAARQRARTSRMLGRTQRTISVRRAGRVPAAMRAPPAAFFPMGNEIKAIDIAPADYPFRAPATNSTILLNGIQTGAAFYNRVGSRVEMRNLHIRGFINYKATSVAQTARLLIVYDRQPTGALPVIADILQSRDQTGTASTASASEINLDNRDRFAIVRDMQLFIPPTTYTGGVLTNGPAFPSLEDAQWDVNMFIRLKEMGTHFKSSTNPTAIGDIATGALYACFVSSQDNTVQASVGFRLRYHDQ